MLLRLPLHHLVNLVHVLVSNPAIFSEARQKLPRNDLRQHDDAGRLSIPDIVGLS